MRIIKPTVTPKCTAVWNSFRCIYVTDIKQEYVILFLAFEMTFFNYRNKKEQEILKIRKKPIYVDFNSYIFTFVTCKPGLKLNLDIDPDPTRQKLNF